MGNSQDHYREPTIQRSGSIHINVNDEYTSYKPLKRNYNHPIKNYSRNYNKYTTNDDNYESYSNKFYKTSNNFNRVKTIDERKNEFENFHNKNIRKERNNFFGRNNISKSKSYDNYNRNNYYENNEDEMIDINEIDKDRVNVRIPVYENGRYREWNKEYYKDDRFANIINDYKRENGVSLPMLNHYNLIFKNKNLDINDKIENVLPNNDKGKYQLKNSNKSNNNYSNQYDNDNKRLKNNNSKIKRNNVNNHNNNNIYKNNYNNSYNNSTVNNDVDQYKENKNKNNIKNGVRNKIKNSNNLKNIEETNNHIKYSRTKNKNLPSNFQNNNINNIIYYKKPTKKQIDINKISFSNNNNIFNTIPEPVISQNSTFPKYFDSYTVNSFKYYEVAGKPFDNPFEILCFYKSQRKFQILCYNNEIIKSTSIYKYNRTSSYCNGYNHLYISGGEGSMENFWDIDLIKNKINYPLLIPNKKFHSMVFIPERFIFIVGGNDKKTFYYDIIKKLIKPWGDINIEKIGPALQVVNNKLYCFDNININKYQYYEYSIEVTDLLSNNKNWVIIKPKIFNVSNSLNLLNQQSFGVTKSQYGNILFLGGYLCDSWNNQHFNYMYNINTNTVELCQVKYIKFNLKEKTFYPFNKKYDFILTDFSRTSPQIAFYNKLQKKLELVDFEPGILINGGLNGSPSRYFSKSGISFRKSNGSCLNNSNNIQGENFHICPYPYNNSANVNEEDDNNYNYNYNSNSYNNNYNNIYYSKNDRVLVSSYIPTKNEKSRNQNFKSTNKSSKSYFFNDDDNVNNMRQRSNTPVFAKNLKYKKKNYSKSMINTPDRYYEIRPKIDKDF